MTDSFNIDDLEEPIKLRIERNNEEFKIQVAIFQHVSGRKTGCKAFNAFICTIYQGRSKKEGFFLKMLGVVAGVADLLVLWRANCDCGIPRIGIGFLEVKKPGEIASTPQRKFQGICHWLKINYGIVRSVQEAHDTLIKWGCPANHHSTREPDTRSLAQKKSDAFEMFKP